MRPIVGITTFRIPRFILTLVFIASVSGVLFVSEARAKECEARPAAVSSTFQPDGLDHLQVVAGTATSHEKSCESPRIALHRAPAPLIFAAPCSLHRPLESPPSRAPISLQTLEVRLQL